VWHHHQSRHRYQGHATSTSPDQQSGSIAAQGAEEGTKAGKKRHKQHRQEATTNVDGGINERAGGSSAEHATEAASKSKHQVRPSKDHLKKLLKEMCLNHAYAVKHKL
jgi:hypothetical protein